MSIAAKCVCFQSPSGYCTGLGERCPYKEPIEIVNEWDDISKSFITQETEYIDKKAAAKAIEELQRHIIEKDKEIAKLKEELAEYTRPHGKMGMK